MDKKVISITLWGNGIQKENWLNWYQDIENLMESLGYKLTHIVCRLFRGKAAVFVVTN